MVLGSGIRDPGFGIRKKPIPDPGSRGQKAPDPGSRIRNTGFSVEMLSFYQGLVPRFSHPKHYKSDHEPELTNLKGRDPYPDSVAILADSRAPYTLSIFGRF